MAALRPLWSRNMQLRHSTCSSQLLQGPQVGIRCSSNSSSSSSSGSQLVHQDRLQQVGAMLQQASLCWWLGGLFVVTCCDNACVSSTVRPTQNQGTTPGLYLIR
jgi:hypothetical protein